MPGKLCQECGLSAADVLVRCPNCGAQLRAAGVPDRLTTLAEQVGRALGENYRVEELVGRGGAAIVFRVYDQRLDRHLAAKVLNPDLLASEELARRFRREVLTAARLNHPNIVPIFFVGDEPHIPCYAMPLIDGESLGARCRREGQLPLDVTLGITKDIANAIDFAHGAGVVHRDVKPDNILLEFATSRSLLMDFGIAKAFQDSDAELTGSGVVIGTPHYVSPEQAAGDRDIDGRTDVYSLGVVVYEMLAGDPPFTASTPQAIFSHHVASELPSVRDRRPDVPHAMASTLEKALDKDRDRRFETAGAFAQALDAAMGRRSLRTSGATVIPHQSRADMNMFRALEVTEDEPAVEAMRRAEDVTTLSETAFNVERFVNGAAGRGDWQAVVRGMEGLSDKVRDTRPAYRAPAQQVLERLGAHPAVAEALAAGWQNADPAAQPRLEAIFDTTPGLAEHVLELASRERNPGLMLLADRVGALTDAQAVELAADERAGVVEAFVTALRESLRPAHTIERWLAAVLRHPRTELRVCAIETAGFRGGAMAERVGRLALGDESRPVRLIALRTLGQSRRREVLPDLAQFLDHGVVDEQIAAAEALGELGVEGAVAPLMRVFRRKRLFRPARGAIQEAAARALARLPRGWTEEALRELAKDRHRGIASVAQQALAEENDGSSEA